LAVYTLPQPAGIVFIDWLVLAVLLGAAAFLYWIGRLSSRGAIVPSNWKGTSEGKSRTPKRFFLAFSLVLVLLGAVFFVFLVNPFAQSSFSVASDQLSVNAPFISATIHTNQVAHAYVVNLTEWNVSISNKIIGDWNPSNPYIEGTFTLSNGASADIATNSDINLVVQTDTGLYVIMAPADFDAFVSDFNANVAPVTPLASSS
jgi:hypothetical protein